jgi:hypothetical protein
MTEFLLVTEKMREALRAPLPPEAITKHPTKTYLSSIKAIYVTERLSDVFGIGTWQLRTETVERAEGGTVVTKTTLTIPAYNIHLESFGGNDNGGETNKNFDLGDAYKGSVTDAITKICSLLEIGIDVFKGKGGATAPKTPAKNLGRGNPNSANTPKPTEKKPKELLPGTKDWTGTLGRMKEGVTIETIKQFFTLSEENEKKIIAEATTVKDETK